MSQQRILLDTNIFLRHWIADVPDQAAACTHLIRSIEQGQQTAMVPPLVFAELGWTLQSFYKLDKPTTLVYLDSLAQAKHIYTNIQTDIQQALNYYREYSIKWTDCLLLSCLSEDMVICSYDRELDKIPSVERKSPDELI